MKITCPNCSEIIIAENINVHDKIAVCHTCDSVFQFTLPDPVESKVKRRKIYQPKDLTIHNTDHLHMSFRTNWKLEENETFLTGAVFAVLFTILTLMMITERGFGIVPLMFSLTALMGYYLSAVTAYNKTHIKLHGMTLKTSRLPLPALSSGNTEINLANIETITTEETAISIKEAYDLPRYNVYANRFDGSRQLIIKDVTEEYGLYIAQAINAELAVDKDNLDTSRLTSHTDEDLEFTDTSVDELHNLNTQ